MRMGKDEPATLYICDPDKNPECDRIGCVYSHQASEGWICVCRCTFRRECAMEDEHGRPMVYRRGKRGKEHVQKSD